MAKLSMTRRSFLKVAAATGAVATIASGSAAPLSALAEDTNAKAEVGKTERVRSTCRGCGKMECGVWVTVKNGRAIKIEGDEDAPQSMGNCCTKSRASLQAAYHPDRLLYPMKRTKPKGEEPGWVRITWDEAHKTAAENFQKVIDKYGPESICNLCGTSRLWSMGGMMAFRQLFGTPNIIAAMQICKGPRWFGNKLTDMQSSFWLETVERPRVFVQWGGSQEISNYDDSGRTIVDVATNADHFISVNPRMSHLGKEADIWLPVRPGTDAALAQAWTNVIIENKLYDDLFVKRWTNAPFLVCEDIEPTEFGTFTQTFSGTYTAKTRLLKESDIMEGGKPSRFMVWDTLASKLTYFDADPTLGIWEGETWAPPTTGKKAAQLNVPKTKVAGWVPDPSPFNPKIDPAIYGEFEVTLKDGRTVKVKPVWQLYADRCAEFAPAKAEKITGVPAADIEKAAKTWATRIDPSTGYGNGGISYSLATEHYSNAIQNIRALGVLSAICGNFDVPAGNRGPTIGKIPNSFINGPGASFSTPFPPAELMDKILGAEKFPLLKWWQWWSDGSVAFDAMLTGKPYPVRAAICESGDFLNMANNTTNWEALKSLDFFLDIDLWHHPTSELADIIMPAQHWLELDAFRQSQGASGGVMGATVKCIEPPGETKHDVEIQVKLFKAMGKPWLGQPFVDPEKVPEEVVWPDSDGVFDFYCSLMKTTWKDYQEAFQEHGWLDAKVVNPEQWGTYRRYETGELRRMEIDADFAPAVHGPGMRTPTLKLEIWSTVIETYLEGQGQEMPLYIEPVCSPVSTPDLFKEYPLTCITGRRIPVYFHSEHRQLPWCREQWPVPRMEINPATAAKLGIKQGDWCWIESPHGKCRQMADLFYGVAPDAINAEHQWWYPEMPAPEHGWRYSAINQLVDKDAQCNIGGSTMLRGYAVKVYKAEEGAPEGIIESAADPRLKDWLPTYEGRA